MTIRPEFLQHDGPPCPAITLHSSKDPLALARTLKQGEPAAAARGGARGGVRPVGTCNAFGQLAIQLLSHSRFTGRLQRYYQLGSTRG